MGTATIAATHRTTRGTVYCLICTRTVEAEVILSGRKAYVKSGQKCPRCASSLDPAYVLAVEKAA